MTSTGGDQNALVSYLTLRRVVGVLGVALPIVLAVWGWAICRCGGIQPSISDYYSLRTRDALGVALFPDSGTTWEQVVHFSCATALFLVLAYFSACLFTKSSGSPTPEKLTRNGVYKICGLIIVGSIVLIGAYQAFLRGSALDTLTPVFWLETFALCAFGFSWFVKGETLWKDAVA